MLPAVLLLSIALLTSGAQNFDDDGPTMRSVCIREPFLLFYRIPMYRKEKSSLKSLKNYLQKKFSEADFEKVYDSNSFM